MSEKDRIDLENRTEQPGDKKVIANPVALKDKIIFPLLIIKNEVNETVYQILDKEGKCFEYLGNTFTGIGIEKNGSF